jgi:hypothetical protein
MKIVIEIVGQQFPAELDDSPTAGKIGAALPIEGKVSTWGEEIYFSIPVEVELDDSAKEVVELGDLGYWPVGRAFCMFFGRTPMSDGDEIRPYSAVNVIGKLQCDLEPLKKIRDGEDVLIREAGTA